MREYSKKSETSSRTLENPSKAFKQAPLHVILQRYVNKNNLHSSEKLNFSTPIQLKKLKECSYDELSIFFPLLWNEKKVEIFLEFYSDEEVGAPDVEKMTRLTQQFDKRGLIQIGVSDLGKEGPQYDGPEIPMIVHRFWSGGPMSDEVFVRLIKEKEKNPDIKMKLWFSSMLEGNMSKLNPLDVRMREEQRKVLRHVGFETKEIESLITDYSFIPSISGVTKEAWKQKTLAAARNPKDIAYLSDIARLIYLYAEGGHHMDVDIGMGDMFTHHQGPYHHGSEDQPDLPLFGALLRDKSTMTEVSGVSLPTHKVIEDVQDNLDQVFDPDIYPEFRALIRTAEGSAATNSLIATHPRNQRFLKGIQRLMAFDGLGPGMAANNDLVEARDLATLERITPLTIPEYLFKLQHHTDESERRYDD